MTFITNPPQDYFISVSDDSLNGQRSITLVGENLDIDQGSISTLWSVGGLWQPIVTPVVLDIVSDSVNDTLGGTGCNVIYIVGQDSSGVTINEILNMDGTNTVNSVNLYSFVERVYVAFAGTSKYNEGTITITAGGLPQASILPKDSVSKSLIYKVPTGKKAALVQRLYSSAKLSGGGSPLVKFLYYAWTPAGPIVHATTTYIDTSLKNENNVQILAPSFSPAGTVFEVRVDSDTNNTAVHGILWIIEKDA